MASDPTVVGSVLQLAAQSEQRRQGGDRQVEEELPDVPQAQQPQVAEHQGGQQRQRLASLPRRVEKVEVALRAGEGGVREGGTSFGISWAAGLPVARSREKPGGTPGCSTRRRNHPARGETPS